MTCVSSAHRQKKEENQRYSICISTGLADVTRDQLTKPPREHVRSPQIPARLIASWLGIKKIVADVRLQ
jgi:hypothetical protein